MKSSFFELLRSGGLEWAAFIVVGGERVEPVKSTVIAENDHMLHWQNLYADGGRDDIYFTRNPGQDSVNCRRQWINGAGPVRLKELGLSISGIDLGGEAPEDFYYHVENPRVFDIFTVPVDFDRANAPREDSGFDEIAGNRWVDPGVICERVGISPYQPFPGILLGNYGTCTGLVHGTLSQKVFYHSYELCHQAGKVRLDIFSGIKAQPFLEVPAEKSLTDLWYLGHTVHAEEFDRIFDGYTAELRKVLQNNYGRSDINRDNMVWGSWNDGIYRKVSEDLILREARYLKEHFPTVRWIQLDDGYAVIGPPSHGLGTAYEGAAGVDAAKFPHGLRHYTDKIREIGLRPALWIGGLCPHGSKIYKEHPEWFSDYSYRIDFSSPLDVSLPEVREYMTRALDILITEGGFEGVKHDFWSYLFEDSGAFMTHHDKSGYEYRSWWTGEIRRRLAPDGYLQTGCDIAMGNPFLGEHFTNYRYGIDVSNGNWEYVKTNFLWGAACFGTHTGDLIVPNSDSVGLFKDLPEKEMFFLTNYVMITRSMVEIAGKLSYETGHSRMKWLKKAACCVNNGQDVYVTGFNYRQRSRVVPDVFYLRGAQFSAMEDEPVLPLRTAGLFNCGEQDQEIVISVERLKLDPAKTYCVVDLWSHEVTSFAPDRTLKTMLTPHESRAFAVAEDMGQAVLLDADIQVTAASREGDGLVLTFAYQKEGAALFFNKPLQKVFAGERELQFTRQKEECVLDLPAGQPVKFIF